MLSFEVVSLILSGEIYLETKPISCQHLIKLITQRSIYLLLKKCFQIRLLETFSFEDIAVLQRFNYFGKEHFLYCFFFDVSPYSSYEGHWIILLVKNEAGLFSAMPCLPLGAFKSPIRKNCGMHSAWRSQREAWDMQRALPAAGQYGKDTDGKVKQIPVSLSLHCYKRLHWDQNKCFQPPQHGLKKHLFHMSRAQLSGQLLLWLPCLFYLKRICSDQRLRALGVTGATRKRMVQIMHLEPSDASWRGRIKF